LSSGRGARSGSRQQSRCRQSRCSDKFASIRFAGHDRSPDVVAATLDGHFPDDSSLTRTITIFFGSLKGIVREVPLCMTRNDEGRPDSAIEIDCYAGTLEQELRWTVSSSAIVS